MLKTDLLAPLKGISLKALAADKFMALLLCLCLASTFYPSDMVYYSHRTKDRGAVTRYSERYARYLNTAAQAGIPILLGDRAGLIQAVWVGLGTLVATQSLKRIFNDWTILGTRLGQRPYGSGSSHNMPSGHSSMASSAMFFVWRRYGLRYAWFLLPFTALTMYARVMLNAHTISAVLSGCLLGMLAAAAFTSPYRPRKDGAGGLTEQGDSF